MTFNEDWKSFARRPTKRTVILLTAFSADPYSLHTGSFQSFFFKLFTSIVNNSCNKAQSILRLTDGTISTDANLTSSCNVSPCVSWQERCGLLHKCPNDLSAVAYVIKNDARSTKKKTRTRVPVFASELSCELKAWLKPVRFVDLRVWRASSVNHVDQTDGRVSVSCPWWTAVNQTILSLSLSKAFYGLILSAKLERRCFELPRKKKGSIILESFYFQEADYSVTKI